MASVEIRGYVAKPEAKTSKGGKSYSKYFVSVKQKEKAYGDKPESVTWASFSVTDFNSPSPPAVKAYVTVKGWLKVSDYEKDGQKRTILEVTAQEVEVAPPLGGEPSPASASKPAGSTKEPWDD